MRIFIGDVQGCAAALERLLAALRPAAADQLYSVGDLVNRGPRSLDVLRHLRALDCRVVLGNHDVHLLQVAGGHAPRRPDDTFDDVLQAPDRDALLQWLTRQPIVHIESDLVLVHAGLHPDWTDAAAIAPSINAALPAHLAGPPDARIRFATTVRYCDAVGRQPPRDDPPPGPPFLPWDHFYRGAPLVVFGHWARRGLVRGRRVRGLDSGGVHGGSLTAWIAEEDRFVQVPGGRA